MRLKREIKKEFGVTPTSRFAGTGVLDVVVDGKTVYSRGAAQRRLKRGEIVRLIQASKPT